MKRFCYFLLGMIFGIQAHACETDQLFFTGKTTDNKRYVEVCLQGRHLHLTVTQQTKTLYHLIQPLTDTQIHTWFDSDELIVKNGTVTLAIIDNPERTSLLTLNNEKGTGYFSDIAHDALFVSKLYALKQQKHQWEEADQFTLPPFIP